IAPVPKSARLVSWAAECSTPVGCPPTPKDYTDRWYIVRGNWLPASSGYKSQMTSVDGVIRDSGERASIPPFADEHAELRETIARWVRAEIVPHVDDWERAREFPRELTEPGAGSDVAAIGTSARKVPGGYVVNGAKTFITNGVRADFLVCAVKTTPDGGHRGLSFLILEREMSGYEVARKLDKLGWH